MYTHIDEAPSTTGGGRLGRHIDRRASFGAHHVSAADVPAPPTSTLNWRRLCPPFDQGALGSCTGNAAAGLLMTEPFHQPGWQLGEADAVTIYERASRFNPGDGVYPPHDVGSSGPCVADALERDGLVSRAEHATDLTTALGLMTRGPVIFGLQWYASFDTPVASGECVVTPGAVVRGGHEVEAFGVDPVTQMVWFYQSWGETWGALGNGTFCLSFSTLDHQFSQGADVTALTLAYPVPALNF